MSVSSSISIRLPSRSKAKRCSPTGAPSLSTVKVYTPASAARTAWAVSASASAAPSPSPLIDTPPVVCMA